MSTGMKRTLVLKIDRLHFVRWLENRTRIRYESPRLEGALYSFGNVDYVAPRTRIYVTRVSSTVVNGNPTLNYSTIQQPITVEITPLENGCISITTECPDEHQPITSYFETLVSAIQDRFDAGQMEAIEERPLSWAEYIRALRNYHRTVLDDAEWYRALEQDSHQGKYRWHDLSDITFENYDETQPPKTIILEHRLSSSVSDTVAVLSAEHTRHGGNSRIPRLESFDTQTETLQYRLTEEGIFSPSLIELTPVASGGCKLRIYPNESHLYAFRIGVDALGSGAVYAGETSPRCTLICIDFLQQLHQLGYISDEATSEAPITNVRQPAQETSNIVTQSRNPQ